MMGMIPFSISEFDPMARSELIREILQLRMLLSEAINSIQGYQPIQSPAIRKSPPKTP